MSLDVDGLAVRLVNGVCIKGVIDVLLSFLGATFRGASRWSQVAVSEHRSRNTFVNKTPSVSPQLMEIAFFTRVCDKPNLLWLRRICLTPPLLSNQSCRK